MDMGPQWRAQGYQRDRGKVYRKKRKEGEGTAFYVHEF